MNWKVRLKNPVWWATTVPTLVGALYLILATMDIAPAVTQNELVTAIVSVATVVCGLIGANNDPTTSGLTDSARAMTYEKPNEDK